MNKDLLGKTRLCGYIRIKVNNKLSTRHLFCVTAKNSTPGDNEIFFPRFMWCYGYLAYKIYGHICQNQNISAIVKLTIISSWW